MTKQRKLKNNEVETLIMAYVAYKKAEANYKALKEKLCKDIAEGLYTSQNGSVRKTCMRKSRVNLELLFRRNPKIKKIDYTETYSADMITVQYIPEVAETNA